MKRSSGKKPRRRRVIDVGNEDVIGAMQAQLAQLVEVVGALTLASNAVAQRIDALTALASSQIAEPAPAPAPAPRATRGLNKQLLVILKLRPELGAQLAQFACADHGAFELTCGECHYAASEAITGVRS